MGVALCGRKTTLLESLPITPKSLILEAVAREISHIRSTCEKMAQKARLWPISRAFFGTPISKELSERLVFLIFFLLFLPPFLTILFTPFLISTPLYSYFPISFFILISHYYPPHLKPIPTIKNSKRSTP